jgi:hypothetical protein
MSHKLIDNSLFFKESFNIKDMPVELLEEYNLLPFGLSSPKYYKLTNLNLVKYVILLVNSEDVLVLFKAITLYYTQYIRLLGFPKTKTNNLKLELATLNLLRQDPLVREIQAYEDDFQAHNIPVGGDYTVDFIVDIEKVTPTLNGAYRSKNRINKNKEHFTYRDATPNDILDILILTKEWMDYKSKKEYVANSMFKVIENHPDILFSKDFITQVLYYDDILFGYSVFSKVSKCLYQYVNIVDTFSTKLPKEITRHGNKIMYYYCILYNNDYDTINFLGANKYNFTLFDAKMNLYKTHKKIYRLPFKKKLSLSAH